MYNWRESGHRGPCSDRTGVVWGGVRCPGVLLADTLLGALPACGPTYPVSHITWFPLSFQSGTVIGPMVRLSNAWRGIKIPSRWRDHRQPGRMVLPNRPRRAGRLPASRITSSSTTVPIAHNVEWLRPSRGAGPPDGCISRSQILYPCGPPSLPGTGDRDQATVTAGLVCDPFRARCLSSGILCKTIRVRRPPPCDAYRDMHKR